MALSFNGTPHISLGTGDLLYRTPPFSAVALINSDALGGGDGYQGLISCGAYDFTRGWIFQTVGTTSLAIWSSSGLQYEFNVGLSSNTGWYLVWAVFLAGTSGAYAGSYRYTNNTFSMQSGSGNATPVAPNSGDHIVVAGTTYPGSGVGELWQGGLSWVGVFDADITNGNSQSAPILNELIVRGPWGRLDSSCKLFLPLSTTSASSAAHRDLSGNGLHGTLVNSGVTFVAPPVQTEFPPAWPLLAVSTTTAAAGGPFPPWPRPFRAVRSL